jgi:hypothetical protein
VLHRPDILKRFRGKGRCELCGRWCLHRDAAHIFSVGGGRVDAPFNLVSVGSFVQLQCNCHREQHDQGANAWRGRMLAVAAKREQTTPEAIIAAVQFFRWLPRRPILGAVRRRFDELAPEAAILVLPYLEAQS